MSIWSLPVFAESWNVAWRKKAAGSIITDKSTDFQIIKNSRRYWAADPFIIEYQGKVYIFAELYDYVLCRGILGCCELIEGKKIKWKPIIKESYHLSYPCIIEYNERIYIMPESGSNNDICLYEAVKFPYEWRKVKTLRNNIKCADTTPIRNLGRKALTHIVEDAYNPELWVIDFDNSNNDKKIDAFDSFSNRPAGNIFEKDNKLYRPAQYSINCNEGYGKGLIFYEININDNEYSEKEIFRLAPSDLRYASKIFLDGMHTYNASEHYEVIDIKTRRFNIINLVFRIICKVRN